MNALSYPRNLLDGISDIADVNGPHAGNIGKLAEWADLLVIRLSNEESFFILGYFMSTGKPVLAFSESGSLPFEASLDMGSIRVLRWIDEDVAKSDAEEFAMGLWRGD